MDIELDPLSPIPIYQQIVDQVVLGIACGRLRRGDSLASVRSLAGAFAINPATVSKAYDQLRSAELVATNLKSGSFVAKDRDGDPAGDFVPRWRERLVAVLAEARAQGVSEDAIVGAAGDIVASFSADIASQSKE